MTNETLPPALIEAEARSRSARERLFGTLDEVQVKLNPLTLAQDAVGTVANGLIRDGIDTVRTRPKAMTAAAGLAILFMARKPLAKLLWKGAKHATTTVPASLKARAKNPKKGSGK
ncbi:phosphatase [Sphingomonas sp. LT1P40]|uniref:phosphatase n=1 Tax=Alteristakelama amylovorans TaxID=3096166 RepID=UPI002FCACC3D